MAKARNERDAAIACRCGNIQGTLRRASPTTVNRVVCYCDDCQAFLHHLGRADLLDAHGGSDIVQVAPGALAFHRGTEHLEGVRLGPKGLFRWYASCCKTPLGNTMTPSIPFVGLVWEALHGLDASERDEVFGPPRARLEPKYAIGQLPSGGSSTNLPFMARTLRLVLGWKLRGQAWPHPFFDRTGAPIHPVRKLSPTERDALRPLCGPR
jgi:hypothetical protein